MARFAVLLVALAAVLVSANCEEFVLKQGGFKDVEVGGLQGIPKVIDTNMPATLNNVAISYSQKALDNSHNLVEAAQNLQVQLANYDTRQRWSVAIQPAAYYVQGKYFAHYLVNNYNVIIYTVAC